MTNSGDSQHFKPGRAGAEAVALIGLLCVTVSLAAWWFLSNGYLLYYGDAQAHLNIARSILDSKTPGYDQLGTVWLPVLHVIMLPFVSNNWFWKTGLAGTIPVAFCFVVAGFFFYFAAREAYGSAIAAAVVALCLILNPNVLYLAVIPMTEIVFLAGLAVLLFAMLRYRATGQAFYLFLGVAASWWMSLTRYDGWFLIPFAGLWFAFSATRRRAGVFVLFGALASLAPLYWMAHNWWETSNALDFYNGPFSAKAIQGSATYPGFHDWPVAVHYYASAGWLCSGTMLIVLGAVGFGCAALKKTVTPILFLMLAPIFYIWSIHSSGNPVFVPQLWHGYYNTRYGIAVVVLCAFSCGAIALLLPQRLRAWALLLPAIAAAPWCIHPSKENWICWKESQVNSVSRRAWTQAAAGFLSDHDQTGQGILTASGTGDIAGIFCRAGIPLRNVLDIGNGPAYMANTARPDLLHQQLWAIAQDGDAVAKALSAQQSYRIIDTIQVPGAPLLNIYQRVDRSKLNP